MSRLRLKIVSWTKCSNTHSRLRTLLATSVWWRPCSRRTFLRFKTQLTMLTFTRDRFHHMFIFVQQMVKNVISCPSHTTLWTTVARLSRSLSISGYRLRVISREMGSWTWKGLTSDACIVTRRFWAPTPRNFTSVYSISSQARRKTLCPTPRFYWRYLR